MTVQLALYKGKGQIGNALIRWWTGSIYSHCELVVDGWCYSSSMMDKGVRRKRIDLADGKWDLVALGWVEGSSVVNYFADTDSDTYGWFSLVTGQLFNLNRDQQGAQFCSQWCAGAVGMPNSVTLNPDTLGKWCRYLGELAREHFPSV
jgi:hypothetical protein